MILQAATEARPPTTVGVITMPMPGMSSTIGTSNTRAHAAAASARSTTEAKTPARSRPGSPVASGAGSGGVPTDIARTLSPTPKLVQHSAYARPDELADDRDGLLGLIQHGQEPVPDVDHRRPFLDRRVDARRPPSRAGPERVVEQHFLAPDLDEQWGQVAEIRKEGRGERSLAIAAGAHVGRGQRGDDVVGDDRI